jgi:hypothetical protein
MRHDAPMTRTTKRIAWIAAGAAVVLACLMPQALAATSPRWSKLQCELQQALFNVRHSHPTGLQLAGGNRVLKAHGCAERVPGPKHWSNTQCADYQATFAKLYAFPTNRQLAAANRALKNHGCQQRVRRPPAQG